MGVAAPGAEGGHPRFGARDEVSASRKEVLGSDELINVNDSPLDDGFAIGSGFGRLHFATTRWLHLAQAVMAVPLLLSWGNPMIPGLDTSATET